jgi:hypothetical protein
MKISYVTFAVGVLYGFGLGVLLSQANLVGIASFSLLLLFLIIVPTLVWIEMQFHQFRKKNWEEIQHRGKFMFVFVRYMLLRGGTVAAVLMYVLPGKVPSVLIHGITVPILLLTAAYVGHQEWENCLRDSKRSVIGNPATGENSE